MPAMALFTRWFLALPAFGLNGVSMFCGLALVQALAWTLGGQVAALAAAAGAIVAALADKPLAPERTRLRVLSAAITGTVSSFLAISLSTHPVWLGLVIVLITFASAMAQAWGTRAGPQAFVGILALVFSLAHPATGDWHSVFHYVLWNAFGGFLYWLFAWWAAHLQLPRLRELAIIETLETLSAQLRTRGNLLSLTSTDSPDAELPLRHWIDHQAALDEHIQEARDLLFEYPNDPKAVQWTDALLQIIELRDAIVVSALDLDEQDSGAVSTTTKAALGQWLRDLAKVLEIQAQALQYREPVPLVPRDELTERLTHRLQPADPLPPEQLATVLMARGVHLLRDMERLQAALCGKGSGQPLPTHTELLRFVTVEGWPLSSLNAHWHWRSPVLRHALRSAAALGFAYALTFAMPWKSHPNWLVLSVAVVLRGNLEQTLSRRNARIWGTVLGCLLVLALAATKATVVSSLLFLVAAGASHAFVNRRYLVTAIAATVMALLQANLLAPEHGFGVAERLGDMLPWWEYRGLPPMLDKTRSTLTSLAEQTLRWPDPTASSLLMRMARRLTYDAIGAIATSAQRTLVEPSHVRLPIRTLAELMSQCHVLLAQIAGIRRLLVHRHAILDRSVIESEMEAAVADIARILAARGEVPKVEPAPHPTLLSPSTDLDDPEAAMRWFERRLVLARQAAARVALAANQLHEASEAIRKA
jgi:hypothetical protein